MRRVLEKGDSFWLECAACYILGLIFTSSFPLVRLHCEYALLWEEGLGREEQEATLHRRWHSHVCCDSCHLFTTLKSGLWEAHTCENELMNVESSLSDHQPSYGWWQYSLSWWWRSWVWKSKTHTTDDLGLFCQLIESGCLECYPENLPSGSSGSTVIDWQCLLRAGGG